MTKTERFILWAIVLWIVFFVGCFLVPGQSAHAEKMRASYYGSESGNRTASGERFRPSGLTAAHRTLPFGTVLRVCLAGRCVVVRVSDRGPAKWTGRSLDLSKGAAAAIGMLRVGVASVEVERL